MITLRLGLLFFFFWMELSVFAMLEEADLEKAIRRDHLFLMNTIRLDKKRLMFATLGVRTKEA